MLNLRLFTSILFALCASFLSAQNLDTENLAARIDSLVPAAVNDTTPGLVLGIVHNSELIYAKGAGLANLAYGIPNDTEMVYNIGSVSKQFLGYAFAMLHVNGDLNIDDPVSQYLDPWPEFDEVVTLRHLLTHTSGYREAYTMSNLAGRSVGVDRLTRDECLEVVRRQPELEFTPGSKYVYNSTAWVILAEVLAVVTEVPADQWVTENILLPLEMNDTQIESYVGEVILNAAESYYHDDEGYINPKSNRAIFGAAEIYSSIDNLVKWIDNYETAAIGGEAVNRLFLEPFVLNDGSDSGYALGIGNGEYRGAQIYRHNGGHEAFITQVSYFPEYDLGIVTISNFGGEGAFNSMAIADILLNEYLTTEEKEKPKKTVKMKSEKLKSLEGLYVADDLSDWIQLVVVDDTLTVDSRNKLRPIGKNEFEVINRDMTMTVNGTDAIVLHFSAEPGVDYQAQSKWEPDAEELEAFLGDYWSEELEGIYHMELRDGNLTIVHRWVDEITLEPVFQDFFSTDWGMTVQILRDESAEIEGFKMESFRTKNIRFDKMGN